MKILNLGCGTKTSDKPEIVNIDYSIALRVRRSKLLKPLAPLFFRGERLNRFRSLPDNILVHDLATGIPFSDSSVDAVYHSHLFEHLDRNVAEAFLVEVRRVLKSGGIHRIVIPDLEVICSAYMSHIRLCDQRPEECENHDTFVARLFEQSVRREAHGTSQQNPFRRFLENRLLGDARSRGETHQWMYDRINLKAKAIQLGYREVFVQSYDKSLIANWKDYGLDVDNSGKQYKPDSLYIEAVK
jgi:hypothetical protein